MYTTRKVTYKRPALALLMWLCHFSYCIGKIAFILTLYKIFPYTERLGYLRLCSKSKAFLHMCALKALLSLTHTFLIYYLIQKNESKLFMFTFIFNTIFIFGRTVSFVFYLFYLMLRPSFVFLPLLLVELMGYIHFHQKHQPLLFL